MKSQFMHHIAIAAGTLIAIIALATCSGVLKNAGYQVPWEPGQALESMHESKLKETSKGTDEVNILLLDRDDKSVDIGQLVMIELHNGRGKTHQLSARGGYFPECDSTTFHAGARVRVCFGSGIVDEETRVEYSQDREMLVVRLSSTLDELVARINGRS